MSRHKHSKSFFIRENVYLKHQNGYSQSSIFHHVDLSFWENNRHSTYTCVSTATCWHRHTTWQPLSKASSSQYSMQILTHDSFYVQAYDKHKDCSGRLSGQQVLWVPQIFFVNLYLSQVLRGHCWVLRRQVFFFSYGTTAQLGPWPLQSSASKYIFPLSTFSLVKELLRQILRAQIDLLHTKISVTFHMFSDKIWQIHHDIHTTILLLFKFVCFTDMVTVTLNRVLNPGWENGNQAHVHYFLQLIPGKFRNASYQSLFFTVRL